MSKPGRNDLCHCGSGKKFKKCHGVSAVAKGGSTILLVVVGGAVLAALVAVGLSFRGDRTSSVRVWDPAHGHYHDANGVQVP